MSNYKINSIKDNSLFIKTDAYYELHNKMLSLKNDKGRIIHVMGAPGTGKSSNIYHALKSLGLKFYEPGLKLEDKKATSKDVFDQIFNDFKTDLDAETREEIYEKLTKYNLILFADTFHDSPKHDNNLIGFSQWTEYTGFRSLPFYFLCIKEYLKRRSLFKNINIVFQTAWRLHFRGKKYDIFTDLGIISKIFTKILAVFFEVVIISYSTQELIKIVKAHDPLADDKIIRDYINDYGYKPRFILSQIEKDQIEKDNP
ncbi:MAG: hypothetical protein ACP5C3_04505 [Methanomicrobiales archaeon]